MIFMWVLLVGFFVFSYCEAVIYSGRDADVHINLENVPPSDLIGSPEFLDSPPPKIYPLTPEETRQLYLRLSSSKSPKFFGGGGGRGKLQYENLNPYVYGGGCCGGGGGNELIGHGTLAEYPRQQQQLQQQQLQQQFQYTLPKPEIRQHSMYGYPTNQVQGNYYGEPGVKPVVEHIEDDIKYDFRTNTHSY